jgi:RNA polymerase sigma-70 factor (ECF subfamily)
MQFLRRIFLTLNLFFRKHMQMERPAMDDFLASVERQAFRMAEFGTRNPDEALDIVQDAMISLVKNYSTKPDAEWKPLFFQIVQNRIRDWHRKKSVRDRWNGMRNLWQGQESEDQEDPIQTLADPKGKTPGEHAVLKDSTAALDSAIETLPWRQQQAFLLRAWEEMSVAETARAMKCSEGSVKTHYSRALHTLRNLLEDHWP